MKNEEREAMFGNLNILETEIAIKFIKDCFERELAEALDLTRVSAPLFVFPESGLNDNLNGVERPVSFDILDIKRDVEVVQSLAKWKRMALKKYGFECGKGLYTDMNAIRRDETLDEIHSIYVDQWDWEKVILPEDRTIGVLKETVKDIYSALLKTQKKLCGEFPCITPFLPEKIGFVSAQELEDEFKALGADVHVATMDGSKGFKGLVTELIASLNLEFDCFYSCGPKVMMKAVCEKLAIPGEASLEERMGCGCGICYGCPCHTTKGAKRICADSSTESPYLSGVCISGITNLHKGHR